MSNINAIAAFIVLLDAQPGQAAPVNGANGTTTIAFKPQDDNRDTLSLIFSCLLTLGLCVYTAVHLNVPLRGQPHWKTRSTELLWCLIGLFGPELVVFAALRQWSSAKELCRRVDQSIIERESPIASPDLSKKVDATVSQVSPSPATVSRQSSVTKSRRYPWTMVHGFYGSMGGFYVEIDEADEGMKGIFGGRSTLTLTAKGVDLLAKYGQLSDISKSEIKDKSKADSLAKFLVCVQAGWMIVQVIARLAENLPVTLLEVNTIGHVLCALTMYILWWNKPRTVQEPTLVSFEKRLLSYMFTASKLSGSQRHRPWFRLARRQAALVNFQYNLPTFSSTGPFSPEEANKSPEDITAMETSSGTTLAGGLFNFAERGVAEPEQVGSFSPQPTLRRKTETRAVDIEKIMSAHDEVLKLAVEALSAYPELAASFEVLETTGDHFGDHLWIKPFVDEFVVDSVSNWPNMELLRQRDRESLVMGAALWGASLVYGAIHCAAWNSFFPSKAEQWMWHTSSIWVAFSALVWIVINLLAIFFKPIDRLWIRFNKRKTYWAVDLVILTLCTLCGAAYIFSRTYLVIGAFVSIRLLPEAAYQSPAWLQVIPHL
ncbi:hypothetical protein K402DRAFT_388242 [Aulographum hederae CBS 113979]|uniref:Uncharacterized protein n=1 Tax=Aulographum hederae CBS 113979 TaxID=1176131 RepID=A0A6G1HHP8_9PEZI|nr:hypothetical protein K402DRAFT_388242 [Aulographum hederae CBS 113979]